MTTTTGTTTTTSTGATTPSQITNLLGAGSGMDIQALSTSLTEAERAPAKAVIDKRIAASTANISGYGAIKYVLGNLQTAFAALKDQSSFNSLNPVNTQPSAFSVTAGASATMGSHTIEVSQLAAAQRNVSAGFASGTTAINGGAPFNVLLSVHGAAATSIAITDTTPRGVAYAINQANLGVTAQIVNTGDATAPYKIMLTGTSGAANDFTMTSQAMPGNPTISTTQGSADTDVPVTETSTVAFGAGLAVGQSMTVGGLTYTASSAVSASELATAFASLADGASSGPGVAKGSYSGSLSGFSTGAVVGGNSITATSSTASSDVTDLRVAGKAAATGLPALAPIAGLDFSTTTQTANNATLVVDGVAVTSSSNQVQDAVPGVTLNLNAKTTLGTPATISFSRDTSAVTTKLQALVTSYNDAVTMLSVVSDPKSTVADYGASLVGNSVVGQVRSQIRALMLGGAAPNAPASGNITALRDLGVSIDSKGVLSLDTTKLGTALSNNFDNAVTMLSANRENLSTYSTLDGGVAGDAVKKLISMLASTGSISTNSANATTKVANYKKDLATLEDRMTKLKARYLAQFAAMDSIVGQSTSLRNGMATTYAGMMSTYTNK